MLQTLRELFCSSVRYSTIAILTFLLGCILGFVIPASQQWPANYLLSLTNQFSRQASHATLQIPHTSAPYGGIAQPYSIANIQAVTKRDFLDSVPKGTTSPHAEFTSVPTHQQTTPRFKDIITSSHRTETSTFNEPADLMLAVSHATSQPSRWADASTTQNRTMPVLPVSSTLPQSNKSLQFREILAPSKFNCPPLVRVDGWNGRVGNHFHSVAQSIVAAQLCGITTVHYPPHVIGKVYQQQDGLLEMPRKISLPGDESYKGRKIPACCPKQFKQTFYHMPCTRIPAWYYREAYMSNAYDYIGRDVKRVVALPRTDFEDNHLLTIHMRGDDITHYPRYMWGQPPCSMYAKIIEEFDYKNIWLVRRGQSPCVKWLSSYAVKHGLSVKSKEQSIAEDFGMLVRAKNLVLSFSSFSVSAALMSKEIKNIYRRRDAAWESILRAVINCAVWTGVQMFEYNSTVITKEDEKKRNPADWLVHFPEAKIGGPFVCDDSSEMGPSI